MLETLKLKYFQGKQYISDIKNAPMREQFRGFPLLKNGKVNEDICPTGALMNQTTTLQKETIPSISHAFVLESEL